MSTFVNHYDVLGVSASASAAEIANAWQDVYRTYTSGCMDVTKASRVEASFKVLSNAEERARFHRQFRRMKEAQKLKALHEENQLLSSEKRRLEQRERHHRRESEKEHDLRTLDAELRHQEKVNEKLRQSLEGFHLGSPKLKKLKRESMSSCVCRFCGKETSRPQSLRQHLTAMSTDMLCVERKILYLLQASDNLSNPDFDLLDGICSKLAKASDEKIQQWEAKVPTLIAFQAKFAEEIALAD